MNLSLLENSGLFYIKLWFFTYAFGYLILSRFIPGNFASKRFVYIWNFCTRGFSMIHATCLVIMSIRLIMQYGLIQIWDYYFCNNNIECLQGFSSMNAFMHSYLTVDVFFVILERNYLDEEERNKPERHLNIIHHVIGALSMCAFIIFREGHFNSLYFSMTEISTIPLHLTWMIMTLEMKEHEYVKPIFMFLGFLTWFLFLTVRIIGGVFLWIYVMTNLRAMLSVHPVTIVFVIGGNGALTILNVKWFLKLTSMLVNSCRRNKSN